MPQLSNNEKRLLTVFGAAIFLIVNFLGWFWVSGAMGAIGREKTRLEGRVRAFDGWKREAADADQKRIWIDQHLPPGADESVRETYLDKIVNGKLIDGLDVEITRNAPRSTVEGAYFMKSRYVATATGPWVDVMEFIYRLQKPSEFRFVSSLTMVPRKSEVNDAEQDVAVTIEIEQWWQLPNGIQETEITPENTEQPAAAGVETPANTSSTVIPPATTTPPAADANSPAPPVPPPAETSAPAPATDSKPNETPKTNP